MNELDVLFESVPKVVAYMESVEDVDMQACAAAIKQARVREYLQAIEGRPVNREEACRLAKACRLAGYRLRLSGSSSGFWPWRVKEILPIGGA
jgi:hypothetical protein